VKKNSEITPIEIDLGTARKNIVNESFLAMFGGAVQSILGAMFGGSSVPVNITGTRSEVSSFAKAMGREKSYIKSAAKYGLNDPRTYKDKYKLRTAISKFERATGLEWPMEG
tara:strand:- start:293 stop:628 length:336 start_codon:yes stop_codon:yes gene_type:complete